MSVVRRPVVTEKLPHFPLRTVRKHFLYVCRLSDKTKVENNFHIGQHSCKNSVQISAKLFFLASRKDLESKLCYFNLEKHIQNFPFFERLPNSHFIDVRLQRAIAPRWGQGF